MIVLGDPSWRRPDGTSCELQFMKDATVVAVVHGDLINKWNVQTAVTGTTLMTATLRSGSPAGFGLLPNSGQIAFWAETPETGRARLGFGQIDFWNHDFAQAGETVEVHGRGVLAPLIDGRLRKLFSGELKDLIVDACDVPCPLRVEGLDGRRVRAYVNAPSAYGALRLLGVSLGFVIQEDPHEASVSILSVKRALEELRARPVTIIGPNQVTSGTMRRGTPVRKRDGS